MCIHNHQILVNVRFRIPYLYHTSSTMQRPTVTFTITLTLTLDLLLNSQLVTRDELTYGRVNQTYTLNQVWRGHFRIARHHRQHRAGFVYRTGIVRRVANRQTVNPGKYADDTYLVIPACNVQSRAAELNNVEWWAEKNHLRLNR